MGPGWGAAHRLSGLSPRFLELASPLGGVSWLLAAAGCDDLQGEVLQFGEQGAEFLCVVEQRLVFVEFSWCESPGDGLAGDFSGPFGIRAVQPGRLAWQRQFGLPQA
jgi:hypothetical protein